MHNSYTEHIKNKGKAGYKLYGGSRQSEEWMDEIMNFRLKLKKLESI